MAIQEFVTKISLVNEETFQESGGSLQLYGQTHLAAFSANTVSVIETPVTGTTSDVVLVWDNTDKRIKIVTQTSIAGQTVAAGNDTEVQFNKIGTTTGDPTFTFNHTNESLTLGSRLGISGTHSFSQGCDNEASGYYSSASGYKTKASGMFSHTQGGCTLANSLYSHAEGFATSATSSGSHSEGGRTMASGAYSHAEGCFTDAGGVNSHAEGYKTYSDGSYSHAQGCYTSSSGIGSHSSGIGTFSRKVLACNTATFNHSFNDALQTLGNGALAPYSVILGGKNHNIGVANTGATIIGGDSIKLTGSTYINTTVVGNLAIMNTPLSGRTGEDIIVWDSVDKKLKIVPQSSLTARGFVDSKVLQKIQSYVNTTNINAVQPIISDRGVAYTYGGEYLRTYFLWIQTTNLQVWVNYYNHKTKTFGTPVDWGIPRIGANDTHAVPIIYVTTDGYIVVVQEELTGTGTNNHNSKHHFRRSDNPEDISTWSPIANSPLGTQHSYPILLSLNGKEFYWNRELNKYHIKSFYSDDNSQTFKDLDDVPITTSDGTTIVDFLSSNWWIYKDAYEIGDDEIMLVLRPQTRLNNLSYPNAYGLFTKDGFTYGNWEWYISDGVRGHSKLITAGALTITELNSNNYLLSGTGIHESSMSGFIHKPIIEGDNLYFIKPFGIRDFSYVVTLTDFKLVKIDKNYNFTEKNIISNHRDLADPNLISIPHLLIRNGDMYMFSAENGKGAVTYKSNDMGDSWYLQDIRESFVGATSWAQQDNLHIDNKTGVILMQTFETTPIPKIIYDFYENIRYGDGVAQLSDLSDVTSAETTSGFALIADGSAYVGKLLVESDISDLQGYWKISGTTNVTNPTISGDTTFSGTITTSSGTAGGYYFGDGDTGFYEVADDQLFVKISGINRWSLLDTTFGSANGFGGAVSNNNASTSTPTLLPQRGTTNTGIGGATGEVSLITSGIEAVNITDDNHSFLDRNGSTVVLGANRTTGDVGIPYGCLGVGTPTPNYLIEAVSSGTYDATLKFDSTGGNAKICLVSYTSTKVGSIEFIDKTAPTVVVGGIRMDRTPITISCSNRNDIAVFTKSGANQKIHLATEAIARLTVDPSGYIYFNTTPISGSTSDQILTRNESSGIIEYRGSSTLGESNNIYSVTGVTGNTTLTSNEYVILVDSSGGALTVTLPSSPTTNQAYKIKDKGNALTNNITIDGNGSNIDGSSTALINTDYGALELLFDSTEWFSLAFIN